MLVLMFLATCLSCGRRELRSTRSIDALVNTSHGVELHFTCRVCGATGVIGGSAGVVPLPAHPAHQAA
ncbi:MAG: hypothetical protein ACRD0A_03205 [Acidimicrobiales bacterium]